MEIMTVVFAGSGIEDTSDPEADRTGYCKGSVVAARVLRIGRNEKPRI